MFGIYSWPANEQKQLIDLICSGVKSVEENPLLKQEVTEKIFLKKGNFSIERDSK